MNISPCEDGENGVRAAMVNGRLTKRIPGKPRSVTTAVIVAIAACKVVFRGGVHLRLSDGLKHPHSTFL
jgi:hypothetical protein